MTIPTFRSRSQLLLCWWSHIIKSHMWLLYFLIDLSVISGNCGAQQYYSSETWVPTCKNLHKSTRFLPQCCVQGCLRQVHLFMASWGPLAAELRRCETPLHPLTLAVKIKCSSYPHKHSLPHVSFRCKAGRQETDISYQLSTQSSINISQMSPNWFAVPLFGHSWLSEATIRDHKPYLRREV